MISNIFTDTTNTLNFRARRQELIAQNLANSDTPGYKAKDLISAFKSTLELQISHLRHISKQEEMVQEVFISSDQENIDGNTVDINREMAKLTENSLHYQLSLISIQQQIQMMKQAIRG